ncbi:rCG37922 [Rattus norvegicus]|uniref:RCG37922 n=1 Tax=Rattus norvegicus TaxID=10116 RepID=A6K657_RAT|nr:rCG37922 [Rattus norvegicus]
MSVIFPPCLSGSLHKKLVLGAGDLAQWLERLPGKRKALGSVPSSGKKNQKKKACTWEMWDTVTVSRVHLWLLPDELSN